MSETREQPVEVTITSLAVGGDGVGRAGDGRVWFVPDLVPGDRALVRPTELKRRHGRGDVVEITEASPDRIDPSCVEVDRGCGGCGLRHVGPAVQRRLKRQMVVDALERIGRIDSPDVVDGPELATEGFRTTVRTGVLDGRAGFRKRKSHDIVAVESCSVAHPLVDELIRSGRFESADEVTLRAGAATGERLVLVGPAPTGAGLDPSTIELPHDVIVVTGDTAVTGAGDVAEPHFHDDVAGVRWRISAHSFFQTRSDGAAVLVELVRRALGAPDGGRLLDAYCGVGLLSQAVPDAELVAVESNRSSVADATVNLADRGAEVVRAPFERWRPSPVDHAVADPARSGLGTGGVERLTATGASAIALVSCDAGSLGRDARLLIDAGYCFEGSTLVDLFPHTPHVEVVSRFIRLGPK